MCSEFPPVPVDPAEECFHRGNRLRDAGRRAEAAAAFREALALKPDLAEAALNLGHLLELEDRIDEALGLYQRAAAIAPDLAEAHRNLGNAFFKARRLDEAAAAFRRTLELRPDWAAAWLNLGNTFRLQNQLDAAIDAYRRVLALQADSADAQVNLANVFRAQNRMEEARLASARALELAPQSPQAHLNAAMTHLASGDLRAGWPHAEYRHVLKLGGAGRDLAQPQWRGDVPLAGRTILLHAEQGFGDTLQFVRYAPLVAALGATVHLEVQPGLRSLMVSLPGMASVTVRGDPLPRFDLHCPLPSLPLAFGTDLVTIPATVPYVQARADRVARWKDWLGPADTPRVGVAWSGNPTHPNDYNRSVPLALFRELFDGLAGRVQFVSLKKEMSTDDAATLAALPEVLVPGQRLVDFADTAALIAQLDLVIAVDTSVAHLAGALGRPVWVLLPFSPDWRWLLGRDDSPWYPTARLFRQAGTGEWEAVVRRVRTELGRRYQRA